MSIFCLSLTNFSIHFHLLSPPPSSSPETGPESWQGHSANNFVESGENATAVWLIHWSDDPGHLQVQSIQLNERWRRICPPGKPKIIGEIKIIQRVQNYPGNQNYPRSTKISMDSKIILHFWSFCLGGITSSLSKVWSHIWSKSLKCIIFSFRMEDETLVANGTGLKPAMKNKSNVKKGD